MRFGLVGTGHWARVTHAPGIVAADDAELVGVWGRRPEAVREIADAQHARAYDDFDALLGDVDAVAFSVPPDVQAPLALKAAQAGKHLLLEKPIALSRSDSDALADAVAASGVASIVFFTTHFQPDVRQWLAWVDGPSDWEGATAHWLGNAFGEDSPYAGSTWRREKGGLWDVGPHTVSMLMTTLGPIDRVAAESGPHDTTALLLHHVSGATSVATLAIDAPEAATVHDLVVWGPRGRSWMPAWNVDPRDSLTEAVQQLVGMARSGQVEHPCDVRHGRDVVDVLIRAADQLRDAHQQGPSAGRHARS
jgi:predicted dehydrogenase